MSGTGSASSQTTLSAAQLREHLKDESVDEVHPHAAWIADPEVRRVVSFGFQVWERREVPPELPDDFRDTRWYQEVLRTLGTDRLTEAVASGNISLMNFATGYTDQSESGEDAIVRAANMLAREGMVALTLGPPGSGKTAFGLDVARTWKALTGGKVVANTPWGGADAVAHTSGKMLDYMGSVEGPVLSFIDEAAQVLTSRGADQQASNQFAKDLKLVRKQEDRDDYAKKGSVLAVGHTENDTAAEIRRVASAMFQKPSRADPGRVILHKSEGGRDTFDEVRRYKGVTDTSEDYDEHDAAAFSVTDRKDDGDESDDVDPEEVAKQADRDRQIATVVRYLLEDDAGYRQAAALTDYSKQWAGERWREWCNGEHRELVEAPDTLPEHVDADDVQTG